MRTRRPVRPRRDALNIGWRTSRALCPQRLDKTEDPHVARSAESVDLLKCSFCGKSQKQVKKLIAGPGVYI